MRKLVMRVPLGAWLCVFACIWYLMSRGQQPLLAPTAVHAQTDSSKGPKRPAAQTTKTAKAKAAVRLFRQHCVKCHGEDGTGRMARDELPNIPNFTNASWQARRTDAKLTVSILEGKGTAMPAAGSKISKEQARSLVAHVRSFAPTKGKSEKEKQHKPAPTNFDERYRRLQEEFEELRKRLRELRKG